jgi:hypothetical protein
MQSLRIKIVLFLLAQTFFGLNCKKESDFKSTKNFLMETTLEIEVIDQRNIGAFSHYWGYVFKIEGRTGKPDTGMVVLKYQAPTNSIVSHKLTFEYTIYPVEQIGHGLKTANYYWVACQDSDFFYNKISNTSMAKTNNNSDHLAPKKTNRIYAEFK